MAHTLLSPTTVNHHHHHRSILTATNPLLPSVHFFSSCTCSTSRIITSHCCSPRASKSWRGRCDAASPFPPSPPESEPPPDDDDDDLSSNSGSIVSLSRFQDGVQIFCAVFFWMSLFFWSSVWDGRNKGRSDKGPRFWK